MSQSKQNRNVDITPIKPPESYARTLLIRVKCQKSRIILLNLRKISQDKSTTEMRLWSCVFGLILANKKEGKINSNKKFVVNIIDRLRLIQQLLIYKVVRELGRGNSKTKD